MISITDYQEYESLVLYETAVGVWVFYVLFSQFTTDWVIVIQTVLFSYIVACFLLKENQRQIVHSFTSIIIFFIFRIDKLILKTDFTKILTQLTTLILFIILKYGESIFFLILFSSMCVIQSGRIIKSYSKWLTIGTTVIFFISLIFTFSPNEVLLLDATTIQIDKQTRISIVDSCSGIYGLIIFLCCFIFFVNVTKTNRKCDLHHIILFGTVGIVGVYMLNLFRIMILIIMSLYFPANIWSEAHIYLGGIFIIGYLAFFWGIIWSKLPIQTSL